MTRREYAEQVCKHINAMGFSTDILENNRNNGSYVGITIHNGSAVSPIINITDMSVDPVIFAEQILAMPQADIDTEELMDIMTDKAEMLHRTTYILVNSQLNKVRPSLVRRPVNETLEIEYKVDISDIVPNGRISLEYKHIDRLGLSEEELYSHAYQNTMETQPAELLPLGEVIPVDIGETPPLYVLTNKDKINGAGVVLYKGITDILKTVAEETILIPSSVHEWIVIPGYLSHKELLINIINEVNSSVVAEEDVLSDRPYELVSDGEIYEL